MDYLKYKDRSPYETLKLIKDYLYMNQVTTIEKWKFDELEYYSLNVSIEGTSIFSNGKGTTRIYALASAYAELMERLNNYSSFRVKSTILNRFDGSIELKGIKSEIIDNYPNYLRKYEEIMNTKGIIEYNNIFVEVTRRRSKSNKMWISTFLNLKNKKQSLELPTDVIDLYYGSNGMAAGNTKSEAIVQGISEILERFSVREVFSLRLTPPIIEQDELVNLPSYSNIINSINEIEKNGDLKVEIRDMSLGINLPVVSVIIYNKKNSTYFVKVGSHPIIDIAIERCFTEMFQGRKLTDLVSQKPLFFITSSDDIDSHMNHFFVNGTGGFPIEFFLKDSSYEKINLINNLKTNIEMEEYLINLIESLGYNAYCSDLSDSYINVVSIIIPGMSEVSKERISILKSELIELRVRDYLLKGFSNYNKKEIEELIEYLNLMKNNSIISEYLWGISLEENNVYSLFNKEILLFYLYMLMEDYDKSRGAINKIITNLSRESKRGFYFECFQLFLVYLKKGIKIIEIKSLLSNYFEKTTVDNVIRDFSRNPLLDLPEVNCNFICSECGISNKCLTKKEYELFNKLFN